MDRSYVQGLIDERNRAWHEAKATMDAAAAEGRALTAEEEAKLAATDADIDVRDQQIKKLQQLEARGQMADSVREAIFRAPKAGQNDELRRVMDVARGPLGGFTELTPPEGFMDYWNARRNAEAGIQTRAFDSTVDTSVIQTSLYAQIQMYQRTLNPTYNLATVLQSTSGAPIQIPRLTADPTVYTPGQGTAITPADPTVSSVTPILVGYKALTLLSNEMTEDTIVNLTGYIAQTQGRGLGLAAGTAFTTGTYGFITLGTNGGTAAGTPFFDADDLISLFYGRQAPYRQAGSWQMSNAAIIKARKFKTTTTGEYLWQPGLTIGTPDTLMGRPVYENPAMATVASASKSVAFGDFSAYFIQEVVPMRVESSRDYLFNTDQTALKSVWRVGGQLPDTTAISYLISYNT